MPFDWSEYLEVARFLGSGLGTSSFGFSGEAAARCAVSRAYYAAFCSGRDFAVRRLSFQPSGYESDHGRLRDLFQRTGRGHLAKLLSELRQQRNRCDYDSADLVDGHEILRDALRDAERIIRACPQLP